MDRFQDFQRYREEYPVFIYQGFTYEDQDDLNITYHLEIPGLAEFHPTLSISKSDIKITPVKEILEYLIFQIGLIECISYVKCTCSQTIQIKAGYIDEEQIQFLKKLYYRGLGEFLYVNGITISEEELFTIECLHEKEELPEVVYQGEGNLICVGGGKDSCVALELLKKEKNNACFMINPKLQSLSCAALAGFTESNIVKVKRSLDSKILELNQQGFLNGHTPFSSIIAFVSYLSAYLAGKENIILSNEWSANQSTVLGTDINHQYSKSFEFENDFREYMHRVMPLSISYFSILRGLSEYNVAKLFSHYRIYHPVFKSCNLGSKEKDWKWCCNCSKCLFIYIILSPFLTKQERVNIFGQDLYAREDLLSLFLEILGYSETKPFECVGTYEEARYAVSQVVQKGEKGYLLEYYQEHYPLELDGTLIEKYNEDNNLDDYYNTMVKEELSRYV